MLFLIWYLLFFNRSQGQYSFDKAITISKEMGLPVADVFSIAKDERGFTWIGTAEGLCMFDGHTVKVFKESADVLHSPYNNNINVVLPVKNKIWMGTRQGLSVLNTDDYSFRHYQLDNGGKLKDLKRRYEQNVTALIQDKSGTIWIGTSVRGVASYDPKTDNFKVYRIPEGKFPPLVPALGSPSSILSLRYSEKNDSIIYAGTTAGLQIINKYTGDVELVTFPIADKSFQVGLNAFRRIYYHADGLLYTGGWASGANVYNPATKALNPIEVKSKIGKEMLKSVIVSLFRKSDHEIWISTAMGLVQYDTKLKDVTWYKLNNPDELIYYSVQHIDESGRFWCSDIGGLHYYDPIMHQIPSYEFQEKKWGFSYYVIPDKTGDKITVCPTFTDGVFYFDKPGKRWTKIRFPGNEQFLKETDVVKGFVELSPGEYIIASDKGIYSFSASKKTIKKVNEGYPFGITRRGDLLNDRFGEVWIADNTWGLTRWNPLTHSFINYSKELIQDDSLGPITRLMNLYEDSRSNIWFQMPGGIGVFVRDKQKIVPFYFLKNETNSFPKANGFAEDKNGRVWISGADGWVGYASVAEPEKGVIYKMHLQEKGISSEVVHMAADKSGNIWCNTIKELIKINPDKLSIITYDFNYGPMDMEIVSFGFLNSGELFMGGRNNLFIVNPSGLKKNTEIPVPYISEILVQNQPVALLKPGQQLSLKSRQNFFSIGFSSIAYTLASGVKYRYRLKDFDNWSEPTTRRFANYTNVPGGEYVFQLQACNNEGLWNKTILELPVHVATPYWQTWWFRIALIVLAALIVYAVYLYRVNLFRKKEKLKSDYEKKIANVEMSSLLAQMNPHFLFNSLNSIDSYIIKNETHKASEYLNNFARLMRLILQNSRSNYISLRDELEALDLYLQMEGLRFKNKFEYEIRVDEKINTGNVLIPPMLIQPFVENAIWHGLMHKQDGEPGKVEIIISEEGNRLKCVVLDNGIGRDKAEEIKMQKTGNRKRSMGMQITSDRIEMINKLYGTDTKVKITDLFDINRKPAGTRVELEIPV